MLAPEPTLVDNGSAQIEYRPLDDAERQVLRGAFTAIAGKPGKYLADIYALARTMLHADRAGRDGDAVCFRFGSDVDHVGLASAVEVGQVIGRRRGHG